ncbi:unnamed protein product [Penicillium salamii]|uniref:BTB domain-containing protein n=1 Tax=Penicillium salamii TaxID=1612424 RepID=A0A9W4I4B1_9EURO|nr:unnamed protein product [Penicillium salamii]
MDTGFEATTSPIFTLLVGPDKKEAYIHSDMLANASDVLSVLVRGDMKEAREKRAEWSHVDEETFSRFFQFVYGKDYIVPSPIVLSTPEEHDDSHPKNTKPSRNFLKTTAVSPLICGGLYLCPFFPLVPSLGTPQVPHPHIFKLPSFLRSLQSTEPFHPRHVAST